jgi:hypothetical protein
MAGERSSIGFWGRFGRSRDLKQLDEALRALDAHPATITEAVKLVVVKLLKAEAIGREPAAQSYRVAAEMLSYCALGREAFVNSNGAALADGIERRITQAVEAAEPTLDTQLILLALESRLIQPSVVQAFELESESG